MFVKYHKQLLIYLSALIFALLGTAAYALYTDGVNMPHKITTYNPDRKDVIAAGLNFDTKIEALVDGIPVYVRFPSDSDGNKIVEVVTFVNDYNNEVRYEYNMQDSSVKVSNKYGENRYDQNIDREMNYIMLDKMFGIVRAAYAYIGVYFNPEIGELCIDEVNYADKIGSGYDVSAINENGKVSVRIAKDGESATFTYDVNNDLFIYPRNIQFASSYDWDVADNQNMALVDDPYGGIMAASAEDSLRWFFAGFIRHAPYPGKYIRSAKKIYDQLQEQRRYANFRVSPMPRLPDPEITDVSWIDKSSGLVRIDGKGLYSNNAPEIYVSSGSGPVKLTDPIQKGVDNWSVINYSHRLSVGENRINAIFRATSNREAESGDITVYIGAAGKPDLILLSPRDRQIVWDKEINDSSSKDITIKIKGKISPQASVRIQGNYISTLPDGTFEENELISLFEGTNYLNINIAENFNDVYLSKKIIGAYEYVCNSNASHYILRRGDFVFNGMAVGNESFDLVPYEPNHAGIYTGNGDVTEAVFPGGISIPRVIIRDLKASWDNEGFQYAAQVPKLINEEYRTMVVEIIKQQKDKLYEIPIHSDIKEFNPKQGFTYSIKGGQYTPDNNMFYCSELAYWGWEKIAGENGFDFGVELKDTMFPTRGYEDRENCSILPAFLNERCMEVKKI